MLKIEDSAELAYGGLVTGMTYWDRKRQEDRVAAGDTSPISMVKRASFWTYLAPGLASTVASAFDLMPKYSAWTDRVAHGFIYGFPGFILDIVQALAPVQPQAAAASAVREAQKLIGAGKKVGNHYPARQPVVVVSEPNGGVPPLSTPEFRFAR